MRAERQFIAIYLLRVHAGKVDDPFPILVDHARETRPSEMEGRMEIDAHYATPSFLSDCQEITVRPGSSIVYQTINATEPVNR